MKYGKTYSTLLSTPTWPQEWRDRALDYRGLKKLLNGVVDELSAQGLNPQVLNELLEAEREFEEQGAHVESCAGTGDGPVDLSQSHASFSRSRAQYEFTSDTKDIAPRLRIWLGSQTDASSPNPVAHMSRPLLQLRKESSTLHTRSSSFQPSEKDESATSITEKESGDQEGERDRLEDPSTASPALMTATLELVRKPNPLYALRDGYEAGSTSNFPSLQELGNDLDEIGTPASRSPSALSGSLLQIQDNGSTKELVIPLTADTAFYRLLATALSSLASLQTRTQTRVSDQIHTLADTIASCSGPPARARHSDLYAWREIFQLWVECQIYRGGATERERANGEGGIRNVTEAENRLGMFASEVVKRGLGDRRTLKSAKSRDALETFLNLNVHILDLKKFELANAEAARKILKKHEKRTALPTAASLTVLPIPQGTGDLTQALITTLTETLLPVLPSLEDYSCLICTSIAFKPIRLSCSHLFCVRCLVKMQKRGQAECPLCRTPCVLLANRDNLDVGLMNFMREWFPKETKEKARTNERESAEEEMVEMGIDPNSCVIA